MYCRTKYTHNNFFLFLLFTSSSAVSGWHVGSTWEQVYRPGQRLRKSLQDCHQKGWAGAWVLQVERKNGILKKKVSRHTSLSLIYICVSVSTLCLVDLQSPTCIDFWTKFTHRSTRPTVRLALCPALKKTHYHVTRCFFVQALYWFVKISGPDCSEDRTFVSICTQHNKTLLKNPLKMFSIKKSKLWSLFFCLEILFIFNWRYLMKQCVVLWSFRWMYWLELQ